MYCKEYLRLSVKKQHTTKKLPYIVSFPDTLVSQLFVFSKLNPISNFYSANSSDHCGYFILPAMPVPDLR